MATLTKASEVMKVIKAGGKIRPGARVGLLALVDKDGNEVQAWQTAMKATTRKLTSTRRSARPTARAVTNEAGETYASAGPAGEAE